MKNKHILSKTAPDADPEFMLKWESFVITRTFESGSDVIIDITVGENSNKIVWRLKRQAPNIFYILFFNKMYLSSLYAKLAREIC